MKSYIYSLKNRIFLILFFCCSINSTFAETPTYFCGGWYYAPDAYYYNLFDQENISQKAFYPFLRTDENPFYKDFPIELSQNVQEWHLFFNKKYSKKTLSNIIYGENSNLSLLKSTSKKETSAITYLKFAKSCEQITVNKEKYYWDYDALIAKRKLNAPQLITEGINLYDSEKNTTIKLRYAYQLIRLYRYNYQFKTALDFFSNEVDSSQNKNEIFYYILDQIAGCHYKLKNYEKAAYLFLKVFDKSIDKKKSAFLSYKFCTYKKSEGKTLLKTKEDKANQIFITAIRNFSDTMQDLEKITALGIAEGKQELLFIRILNNIERTVLNIDFKKSIFQEKEKTNGQLQELQQFVAKKIASKSSNLDFWKLTDAYLSFLNEDFKKAKEKLNLVTTKRLKYQKESLATVFEVFSWDKITPQREVWLSKLLGPTTIWPCETNENRTVSNCNLKGIIGEQLSHLYLQQDKIAQAYLLHNNLKDTKNISSHKLVDDLLRFIQKQDKNAFEKLLLKDAKNKKFNKQTLLHIANEAKGYMYFRSGNFNKALPYFNISDKKNIPATVFSNNTMECFNCKPALVMEDQVYKASAYLFLNKKMNKHDLLSNLQQLEQMTQNTELKQWKRKLAYYLLGNYFFNVSNTGYYRALIYPNRRYYYNYYFGEKRPEIADVVDKKATYSFPYGGYANTYNGLAKKAKLYYENTIILSTDNELNARCAYMIAKCELNDFYNNVWKKNYYDYDGNQYNTFKNSGFEALKTKYNNTNFYQTIRSKCNFFAQYDAD